LLLHGSGARQYRVALLVFEALNQYVNFVAAFYGEIALSVNELFARDDAFALVAYVYEHVLIGDAYDHASNDLALLLGSGALLLVILKQRAEVAAARFGIAS